MRHRKEAVCFDQHPEPSHASPVCVWWIKKRRQVSLLKTAQDTRRTLQFTKAADELCTVPMHHGVIGEAAHRAADDVQDLAGTARVRPLPAQQQIPCT
jgi:hypothetical protein